MLSQFLIASAIFLPVFASTICNSKDLWCCTNTTTVDAKATQDILAAYSISYSGLTDLVGIECTTSNGNSECVRETVCCTTMYYGGAIGVNCTVEVSS